MDIRSVFFHSFSQHHIHKLDDGRFTGIRTDVRAFSFFLDIVIRTEVSHVIFLHLCFCIVFRNRLLDAIFCGHNRLNFAFRNVRNIISHEQIGGIGEGNH